VVIDLREIVPLTDFVRNTKEYIAKIKESRRACVLTVNGKAVLVVQDIESYQKLLDRIDYLETAERIRRGLEECERGECIPVEEAFAEFKRKYDL
jgi:PHD/YefM family antitoxin component YafN of YafNO toxin-antitoxin module